MISGEFEVKDRMQRAAGALEAAGIPATYLEMPGAKHGQMGDAERIFSEAFSYLDAHAPDKPF